MATPFTPSAGESGCMDIWFPAQHKEAKLLISTKGKIDEGFLKHLLLRSLMFGAPSFLLWSRCELSSCLSQKGDQAITEED